MEPPDDQEFPITYGDYRRLRSEIASLKSKLVSSVASIAYFRAALESEGLTRQHFRAQERITESHDIFDVSSSQLSGSLATIDSVHQELIFKVADASIRIFRVSKDNIPKEFYLRDLIGFQVYRGARCTMTKSCEQLCSRCGICCHELYCTCQPLKFRSTEWCIHKHSFFHKSMDLDNQVVFILDMFQQKQPQLAHIRASCYDLKKNISEKENCFQVKEFSRVTATVTRGSFEENCGSCPPTVSCSSCNICIHVFACNCLPYRRKQLCEHCHAVVLYKKRLQHLPKNGSSEELSNSDGISMPAVVFGEAKTSD